MTRAEFAGVITWLSAAVGKPIAEGLGEDGEKERKARMDVYFDCLGDLPVEVLQVAAKIVAMAHPWSTFPSIAELREAAAQTAQGQVQPMSGAEAWALAWRAACRIDPEVEGSAARHTAPLPPLVAEAMRSFGVVAMTNADPNFARPQFIKIFEALTEREQRHALLPASVKKSIAALGHESKQIAEVRNVAKQIGEVK